MAGGPRNLPKWQPNIFLIFFVDIQGTACKIPIYLAGGKKMTIQVQHTISRLTARHGYSATFIQNMGEGITLWSIGGIMYRLRGDGTIL